jgi:hypothetical protein
MGRASLFFLIPLVFGCGGRVDLNEPDPWSETERGAGAEAPPGPGAPCPTSPLPRGPLPALWYELEGDAKNTGLLGHEYDAISAGVAWVEGRAGQGAVVGEGYIEIPGSASILSSVPAVTIALWVRAEVSPHVGGEPFLDCRSFSQGFHSYRSYHGITTCAGHGATGGCDTFEIEDGCWHHIIYRYASTSAGAVAPLIIYLDGNEVAWVTTESNSALFNGGANDIRLGLHWVGSGWEPAHHLVDDLRVYGTVFPEEEQCTGLVGGTWVDGWCVTM